MQSGSPTQRQQNGVAGAKIEGSGFDTFRLVKGSMGSHSKLRALLPSMTVVVCGMHAVFLTGIDRPQYNDICDGSHITCHDTDIWRPESLDEALGTYSCMPGQFPEMTCIFRSSASGRRVASTWT